ncbi:MAG: hypothetical protein EXS37_07465 [Opitutus sp.]|nr:hypothetical protein [Opitutus sp.]
MTKPLLLSVVVAALAFSTGCSFFKKSSRSKESSAIATEVEETFRKRWVDKRTADLAATGTGADASRVQAETEFREKFGFNQTGKK